MSASGRILDAAYELTVARGWAKVTMSELAGAAGVSRQSVYNEFGTREGVAAELVRREVDGFLMAVDTELGSTQDPIGAVVAAATAVFDMADANPLVRAVLASDDSTLLPLMSSEAVIAMASHRVSDGLSADQVAIDTIVRLVISHVVSPGPARPDMAEVARRLLGPQVIRR